MSNVLYQPKTKDESVKGFEKLIEFWDTNFSELMKCDEIAKANGTLIGRVISHPIADGKAWYQVVKESAKSCTIQVCRGIGDDWVLPAWGEKCSISKTKILDFIGRAEALARIFGTK